MRAGELRERITIQRNRAVRDAFGAPIPIWSTLATVWAKIETTSGSELVDTTLATQATLAYNVTIRYRTDVASTMRVVWGARVLEISAVLEPDNARKMLNLVCTEIIAAPAALPFTVGTSPIGGEDQIA